MRVKITAEALAAIAAAADPFVPFNSTLDDKGTIEVSKDVLERLKDLEFPGETLSDTIIRVIATSGRPN